MMENAVPWETNEKRVHEKMSLHESWRYDRTDLVPRRIYGNSDLATIIDA